MKKLILGAFLIGLSIVSCTNSKDGAGDSSTEITQEMVSEVVISNFTVQEQVSGVQGAKNRMQFLLNVDAKETNIVLDSLYYRDYACKLQVKNKAEGLYVASAAKKESSEAVTKEMKFIRFTIMGSKEKILIGENELKKLQPLYMP